MKKKYFIEIEYPSKSKVDGKVNIQGQFKVPNQDLGLKIQGVEVLKHIVLAVTMGGCRAVVRPFENYVVFEDDIQEEKQGCSGFFKFNLFDKISFTEGDDYYIMCSLGTLTSDVIKVSV